MLVMGFTLIETLAGISILLLAITGALTVGYQNISFVGDSADNITAFYLAEEAVEFIKNKRDNNKLQGLSGWVSAGGLSSCNSTDCYIDVVNNTMTSCGGACPVLRNNGGYYQYSAGSNTVFTRTVRVTEIAVDREATIDVSVSWSKKGISRTVSVRDYMYNWE